jgi:hypothetical protein
MRVYRPQFVGRDSDRSYSSEYIESYRSAYVGCTFILMVEAGSALVEVSSISDDSSVVLTRQCRQSGSSELVLALSDFLAGLDCGVLIACR